MKRAFAALALMTAALPRTARADEPSDLQELLNQTVVTAASRGAEVASTAPATSTIISGEELHRYGVRTLADAINFLSMGMTVTDRLDQSEIGARGVLLHGDYGNHVLVLVNNHVINEQWSGSVIVDRGAGIPLEFVDHIEVILGPGSVMYGSNAMLGVINVVTKRAQDYAGVHLIAEGDLFTAYRVAAGAGVTFKLFGLPGELAFQMEYAAQHGPTFHFGPQYYVDPTTGLPKAFAPGKPTGIWGGDATNSYYSSTPLALWRLTLGELEVNARFARYLRSEPMTDSVNFQLGDFNLTTNNKSDQYLSLDIAYRRALTSAISLRTRLYGDIYEYQWWTQQSAPQDCSNNRPDGCRGHLAGFAQWAGLEVQPTFDWLKDGSLVTMVGIDGRVRHVASVNEEYNYAARSATCSSR